MNELYWWGKQIVIGMGSLFFLLLGIDTLISAYSLNSPPLFIMYFFSSNLIILISIVGLLYPVIKIYTRLKPKRGLEENEEP